MKGVGTKIVFSQNCVINQPIGLLFTIGLNIQNKMHYKARIIEYGFFLLLLHRPRKQNTKFTFPQDYFMHPCGHLGGPYSKFT